LLYMNEPFNASLELMQYTWLKDKNGAWIMELYEYDIVNKDWYLIGNYYKNNDLLEDKSNILVERIFSEKRVNCYKKLAKLWRKYA
jgi:hypothetical protein